MNDLFFQLQKGWKNWQHLITRVITQIALAGVYLFGIGFTSVIAKLLGKKFLYSRFSDSSWQPMTGSERLEKMF